MTFYVSIQDLDYDDYPVGGETKVGWFHSAADAEKWLESSGLFRKRFITTNFHDWQQVRRFGKHTVAVKNVLETYVERPEHFVDAWRKV